MSIERCPGTDEDGSHWLYYSIAGESGIAVARLAIPPEESTPEENAR